MIKNVKLAELNTMIATAFLNIKTLLEHLRDYSGLCYIPNYRKKFDKNLKKDFLTHNNFSSKRLKNYWWRLRIWVCKDLKIKSTGECRDFYVQGASLLLDLRCI